MINIGLTQRVSDHFYGQPHDCLDESWTELLLSLDLAPVPLPNIADLSAATGYLDRSGIDGLILTGGNDISGLGDVRGSQVSSRRDAFEKAAIAWARPRKLPIFAVCRGMQLLNLELGGTLSTVDGHVGTKHSLSRSENALPDYFSDLPDRFDVNSFHSYTIAPTNLAPDLKSAAIDGDRNVEAVFHPDERIAGIMWHPERVNPSTELDHALLRNFFCGTRSA